MPTERPQEPFKTQQELYFPIWFTICSFFACSAAHIKLMQNLIECSDLAFRLIMRILSLSCAGASAGTCDIHRSPQSIRTLIGLDVHRPPADAVSQH